MKATYEQYARAVLALGLSETELDAFQAQLNAFAAVFSKNRSLRQYLMNPQRTTSEKVQWLASDTSELFARFILTVLQTSGAKKVSAIAEKLLALRDARNDVVACVVSTPAPLSEEQQKKVNTHIEHALKKKIRLETTTDASLIGGMTLKIGDRLIDDSIKTRLELFRKSLTRN